jgi:hypothetical protein
VSRTDTLRSFEVVLESFLERAVSLKTDRMQVIDGINRLDDIAGMCRGSERIGRIELSDRVGDWFARHSRWIEDGSLRTSDRNRIGQILGSIRQEIERPEDRTPASEKILTEIKRWRDGILSGASLAEIEKAEKTEKTENKAGTRKITLRKGPESTGVIGVHPSSEDSIALFGDALKTMGAMFVEASRDRVHLMSVLSDALNSATLQKSREALLLSALIIYYLKQNGYMVEPFVKRLKEAEHLQKGVSVDA